MAVSPNQLKVVQCLRKFAYTYGFDPALPQEWDAPGGPAAQFGKAVHLWIENYAKTGVAADPESRVARCASQVIPLLGQPGASHEQRIEALYNGTRMAARVDMLVVKPDRRAAPKMAAVGYDWKTGQRSKLTELREDVQWNITAYVLGSNYGWPIELRWVYLDKDGKKPPHIVADVVADNTKWMAALDESIHDVEIMWELKGTVLPSETPPNPLACDMRGKYCDFSGHCDFKGIPGIMTADELKAAYAKRLQGNAAVNPPEIPAVPAASQEELDAKQTRQPAEAEYAAANAKLAAEAPLQPYNNLEVKPKRGRPVGSKNAPKEPAPAAAEPTPPTSPAVVSEAPLPVRSTWTLGDLQRLAAELASHGIKASFSFEER